MPEKIDVSGLTAEAVHAVETLVKILREKAAQPKAVAPSIFDLFGSAPRLRTGEDIARQLQEERDGWGEP